MTGRTTTAVDEAQSDIREHAQAVVSELGSLAQETSGGSELRDMVMRAAKLTAALDPCIRDTQQALLALQTGAIQLAERTDESNEQWKSLAKTIDILKAVVAMEPERKLVILYGSQTGYAEDTARRIARQAWRRHFVTQVQALDQADKHLVFSTTSPVIFVCSTTGQGEEPDNMKRFWRFLLRKSIPHDALASLQFAVFGLGDSSYQKFNFPAKRLFRRLQQLGGSALVARGDGDDQHYLGVDGQLDPWLVSLWDELLARMPLPQPIIPESVVPDPTFDVSFCDGSEELPGGSLGESPPENTYRAVLTVSERITAEDHFQDVRHLRFAVDCDAEGREEKGPAVWGPGDCAVLRPQNFDTDVDGFLAATGWTAHADRPLRIVPRTATRLSWDVPPRVTLRWLCTNYFDIMGVPRRSFFEMLSYFGLLEEQDKLREFSSTSGQDDLLA
ncbi:NAPDH-dependent diflavin reductase, partial [Coemansia sp. RSA 1694]